MILTKIINQDLTLDALCRSFLSLPSPLPSSHPDLLVLKSLTASRDTATLSTHFTPCLLVFTVDKFLLIIDFGVTDKDENV